MNNDFFSHWLTTLPRSSWPELGDNPKKIALISVDMIVGFCHTGPLASVDIKKIIPHTINIFTNAYAYGISHFVLIQDAHDPQATEFTAYPPHCIKGSEEANTIPELQSLPFANQFKLFEKNSLSPAYTRKFNTWIAANPQIETFIVVGNCTDLCIYAMAMHLKLQANAINCTRRVVVIEQAVATYDISIEEAKRTGGMPHDGILLHGLFLYHMALNAIEVIKDIY